MDTQIHCSSSIAERYMSRIMTEADIFEASQLIAQCFAERDILSIHVKMDPQNDFLYIQSLLQQVSDQQLSVVMIDTITNKLVGACMVHDYYMVAHQLPHDILKCSPEHYRIYEMLGLLDKMVFEKTYLPQQVGDCAFYAMGATSAEHSQRGIGTALAELFINQAKELGYKRVYCQSTTLYTSKIFERFGGEVISTLMYSSFIDGEGNKTFETLNGCVEGLVISF